MNITVLDDWQDTVRTLPSFAKVAGHDVTSGTTTPRTSTSLAKRLADTEALCLIRERTPIRAPLLERLDRLRIISQIGVFPHVDVEACTRRGVIMSSPGGAGGGPSYATAELTWGMIIAAFRRIPQEMAALQGRQVAGLPDRRRAARQDARHLGLRQDRRRRGRLRPRVRHEGAGLGPRVLAGRRPRRRRHAGEQGGVARAVGRACRSTCG